MMTLSRRDAQTILRNHRLLRPYEREAYLKVLRIFVEEYNFSSKNLDEILRNGLSFIRKLDFKYAVKKNLDDVVRRVIVDSGTSAEKGIARLVKKSDFDYEAYIQFYLLSDEYQQAIESIKETFYEDLMNIITSGIAAQMTREELRDAILSKMINKSKYRAETIAITESHRAANYASFRRAEDINSSLGLNLKKKWIAVQDSRTRNAHMAMRGSEAIPINEFFIVGGEKMSRPHDSRASASNTIRCRCVLRYITED